jgi:hypothetical protein
MSGKLHADVVAPPGTRVTVVGTGAFKKTEVNRRFTTGDIAKAVTGEQKTAQITAMHGTPL